MRDLVYISYSHNDEAWRLRLWQILSRDRRINLWDDTMIPAGSEARKAIDAHVMRARIMIMLISDAYLDPSCGVADSEIEPALEAAVANELTILAIPIRASAYRSSPLQNIQPALDLGHPLASMAPEEQQAALEGIYHQVLRILNLDVRKREFDVFLSHNSKDKPAVRQLASLLRRRGLWVWLDEWELPPGSVWQKEIEAIIKSTRSAMVLVGKDGLGPWEDPEMRVLLSEYVRRQLPVVPVLLPSAPRKPELPSFLNIFTWVDLHEPLSDQELDRLEWGITGKKPGELFRPSQDNGLYVAGTKSGADPTALDANDWTVLVRRVSDKRCTPILGPEADRGTLPHRSEISKKWAADFGYPLEDSEDLARVAQFVATALDRDQLRQELWVWYKNAKPPHYQAPDSVHGLLGALELPVYITTCYDDYLVQALRTKKPSARQELCKWNRFVADQKSALNEGFEPTSDEPVVFHLYGHGGVPNSMVVTEDDYLDFLINTSREEASIPLGIQAAFTNTSLLLLGYELADVQFRVLLRSLSTFLQKSMIRKHVSVLQVDKRVSQDRVAKVREYLAQYLSYPLNIKVYWGTPQEFLGELTRRLKAYAR
jgi:TIR domain/SIR2-like domain